MGYASPKKTLFVSASCTGSCPTSAESLAPLPDPQGPSSGRGGRAGGGTTADRVEAASGSGSAGLSGVRLRAGARPRRSPPHGRSALPAGCQRHLPAGPGITPVPWGGPRVPSSTPRGRSSAGARVTCHTRTCSFSSAAKGPQRGQRQLWKTGRGQELGVREGPGSSAGAGRVLGKPVPTAQRPSRPSAHPRPPSALFDPNHPCSFQL